MMHFGRILDQIALPLQLPEHLGSLKKSVDALIDGFIQDMQQLKTVHAEYYEQYLDRQLGTTTLRRKLTSREALGRAEATGNGFFRIRQEASRLGKVTSPYKFPPQELALKVEAIRSEMATMKERVRQLWENQPVQAQSQQSLTIQQQPLPRQQPAQQLQQTQPPAQRSLKFSFSSTLKHKTFTLSEGENRAIHNGENVLSVAIAEPRLRMDKTSKIAFRVNEIKGYVLIGVCYSDIIRTHEFRLPSLKPSSLMKPLTLMKPSLTYDVTYEFIAKGIYGHFNFGHIVSHSISEDCGKQTSLNFDKDETITVEFDPATGRLTFAKHGASNVVQQTSIRSSTTEPIHFFVAIYKDGSTSIADQ